VKSDISFLAVLFVLAMLAGCNKQADGSSAAAASAKRLDVKVGDMAPDFTLHGYPVDELTLSSLRGQRAVVLYFYPRDKTPDCTTEACTFRDTEAAFARHGAAIIGVSSDGVESHTLFADELSLPFPLLSDVDGTVRQLYGNPDGGGALDPRITYVIDKRGVIVEIINGRRAQKLQDHIDLSLATVAALTK